MLKIGIDTGGTFTDFIAIDRRGVRVLKLPSTPENPALAILSGLRELAGEADCEILHGSTVATNALLERKGAVTALLTTKGFEDVLEIGRQNRPAIYSLFPSRPAPLVPSGLRLGVTERVLHDGSILIPLNRAEFPEILGRLRRAGVESVAVCLLFSFACPAHEKEIALELRSLGVPVSLSHSILPEYREYERTSTTVVNAYLAPVMGRYLEELESRLSSSRSRVRRRLRVMQSNGGAVSARVAISEPVRTVLSGPAGGVVGAWEAARLSGFPNIITIDMGGTSTDTSLCEGEIRITGESAVARCPIGVPVIDIHTVGAGGGSIARVDEGGALLVGPESAGAAPGPICYGKGKRITVTDANLYLGKLDTAYPLGGSLYLQDRGLGEAFSSLARRMRADGPEKAAQGVIEVANANMAAALRVISVERGHDPRDFTLVTFGGAGGLHAIELATSLAIPRVLVPENPGLLSALGVLLSDSVRDFSQTVMMLPGSETWSQLERRYLELSRKGISAMKAEGFSPARIRIEKWIDMRYRGQSYEISLPFTRRYEGEFHKRHEHRYGYADPLRNTEIVTLRIRARGLVRKPRIPRDRPGPADPSRALLREKRVRFGEKIVFTRVYERSRLRAGNRIAGPALIYEYSASTAIPPGSRCLVDPYRNLVIECK